MNTRDLVPDDVKAALKKIQGFLSSTTESAITRKLDAESALRLCGWMEVWIEIYQESADTIYRIASETYKPTDENSED